MDTRALEQTIRSMFKHASPDDAAELFSTIVRASIDCVAAMGLPAKSLAALVVAGLNQSDAPVEREDVALVVARVAEVVQTRTRDTDDEADVFDCLLGYVLSYYMRSNYSLDDALQMVSETWDDALTTPKTARADQS